MINRLLEHQIVKGLTPNKVIIIYGPRRTGKTTLLKKIAQKYGSRVKMVDGEDYNIQKALSLKTIQGLKGFLGKTDFLIIDEAQKIPEIGISLKLIVDHFPGIRVIASGSASFSLAQKVGEPLTGRQRTFHLYPLSLRELLKHSGAENAETLIQNHFMIFGGYPETFQLSDEEKEDYLKEVAASYLFKDILEMELLRHPKKLRDLLTLLAFQIGKEVSLSELGSQLDLHKNTVAHYLDLLEKSFVILNVRGFSRNLRKEVTKNSRYYFYDNGVRNALINNFNPLSLRNDAGELWENFMATERLKKQEYEGKRANNYFWRTYDQQEIDWVEERQGKLFGYEFKWRPPKRALRPPSDWSKAYKEAEFRCIHSENYLDFI